MFFLIKDPLVVSLVDIHLGTLPSIYGELKTPYRFGESTRVFTKHTSTAYVPTSSVISIFETLTGENISTLLFSDTTIDSDSVSDDDHLITLCKCKSTCTTHPITHFVSYSHLSPSVHAFISSLDSYFVPKSVLEAIFIPGWKDVMKEEILTLKQNENLDLAILPPCKKPFRCRWLCTVKLTPRGPWLD